ncbi:hypothetical protein [Streptosporangium roseum]|uniref:Uncharacterized protein n=1 Tax=Streptosporangium roseum (strain ATCC 12428 / DSM 43021 / JCM 3005 / KCTC 9067 / NCIMB 10171 / NRRL 2505 / NI 9100) TaxID=479432 RepID=D2B631_STRRD|nr:hypothetical protein [Streptosporangium roseum]ACZ83744.1 hypothetical protein Sros_0723 [Streptosporangium roseum DSM 43021]
MNTREPDWAYMARSLLRVVAVTAALFLALSAVERISWVFIDFDDERTAQVYGTTARVANSDKRLFYSYDDGRGLLGTTYTLWGEPRRAGPSEDETGYEITENLFGTIRAPSLDGPSGSLGDAIASVEADPGADKELTEKARKTIDGLPQTLDAVAVVEFANAMTTERLVAFNRKHKLCGGADVSYIYAPAPYYDDSSNYPPLNAVVWNRNMTEEYIRTDFSYQCETEPEAALAEFRRWVGLLDEGDDLSEFELDHYRLTDAAKAGVVHGLVVDRWKLADLRKLLDDPEVRTVRLADVAFDLGEIE